MSKPLGTRNPLNVDVEELSEPLTCSVEPHISEDYARAEADRLWPKVWQHAGRVEEIPNVGDFLTYDIGDDSIIVVRTAPDTIKAYHNVCSHRGRRLVRHAARWSQRTWQERTCSSAASTAGGTISKARTLSCSTSADWKGALHGGVHAPHASEGRYLGRLDLRQHGPGVRASARISSNPPHRSSTPSSSRRCATSGASGSSIDCNWKTAIEAFMEPYHVEGTHTQLLKYGQYYAYSAAYGLHGVSGFDERDPELKMAQSSTHHASRQGQGSARVSTYELARGDSTLR